MREQTMRTFLVWGISMSQFLSAMVVALFGSALFVSCKTASLQKDGLVKVDKSRTKADIIQSDNKFSLAPAGGSTEEVAVLKKSLKSGAMTTSDKIAMAQVEIAQGRYQEAETLCQEVLGVDAQNADALKTVAALHIGQKRFSAARFVLTSMGDQALQDSDVQNMFGLLAMYDKDYTEASSRFEKGLQLNPDNVAIRLNLASLYLKNRYLEDAATHLTHVLKLVPQQKDAKMELAIIYAAQSKTELAADMYKELADDYGENPILLYNMAALQKNSKMYDKALNTVEKYLSSESPKDRTVAEAFVRLIAEIEKGQAGTGKKVSSDIKSLAAQAVKDAEKAAVQVAQTPKKTEPKVAEIAKVPAKPASPAPQPAANVVATPQEAAKSVPKVEKKKQETLSEDDIEALEKELAH